MKRTVSVFLALILLLAGCSSKPTTQTPPPVSEQVISGVQQETQTPEPTPVVPEDNKQEQPEGTSTPEPSVTPDPTPSIEPEPTTTPEVADPTPEPTPSVEPTPEPEPIPTPQPTPTPTPEPTPEVTPTPEPTPEPSVEPTPTPDATIEINGGSTTEPTPSETPEVELTGTSWVEGQKHNYEDVKAGATVIKADGTKVVLTATKVGNLTILGYGQGVDPYSGVVLSNGTLAGEGTASWYDYSTWVKCPITGSMYSSKEWGAIENATFPGRGVKGSYEGEVRNIYWEWSTEMNQWMWIGPYFAT